MNNTAVVISLIGLMIIVGVHIAVIARWSGKIDGFITSALDRIERSEDEIERLRDARHSIDGTLQRHEGLLKEYGRRSSDQVGRDLG